MHPRLQLGSRARPLNFTVRPPHSVPTSQNLCWRSPGRPEDSPDHRPGRYFAETVRAGLLAAGWDVDAPDDWRDVGWLVRLQRNGASIAIFLARLGQGDEWMLQIAPERVAGLIGRVLGRANSATSSDVLTAAHQVHSTLSSVDGVSSMRWRWDGRPGDGNASPQPAAV